MIVYHVMHIALCLHGQSPPHCGTVTPYGVSDLSQDLYSSWLYINQCLLITNWTTGDKFQSHAKWKANIYTTMHLNILSPLCAGPIVLIANDWARHRSQMTLSLLPEERVWIIKIIAITYPCDVMCGICIKSDTNMIETIPDSHSTKAQWYKLA